jgi:hypothetical protein
LVTRLFGRTFYGNLVGAIRVRTNEETERSNNDDEASNLLGKVGGLALSFGGPVIRFRGQLKDSKREIPMIK